MSSDQGVPSAIRLEQVTKRYRAGRSRTVIDLVASNLDRLRGKAQDVHSVTRGKIDATIWALRDVDFDVPEGAGVGVIGRNGAGKTTLLKLISRVTWPTSGRVRVAGRVVSLIESLLAERVSNASSVRLMEHAATLDLEDFEDADFQDQLERARRQTSGRMTLMGQLLSQAQDIVTVASFVLPPHRRSPYPCSWARCKSPGA